MLRGLFEEYFAAAVPVQGLNRHGGTASTARTACFSAYAVPTRHHKLAAGMCVPTSTRLRTFLFTFTFTLGSSLSDFAASCIRYAYLGYCAQNSFLRLCEDSCGVCSRSMLDATLGGATVPSREPASRSPSQPIVQVAPRSTISATPPTPMPTRPTAGSASSPTTCADRSRYCAQWTLLGYCSDDTYGPFMARDCPPSCGLCTPPATIGMSTGAPLPPTTIGMPTGAPFMVPPLRNPSSAPTVTRSLVETTRSAAQMDIRGPPRAPPRATAIGGSLLPASTMVPDGVVDGQPSTEANTEATSAGVSAIISLVVIVILLLCCIGFRSWYMRARLKRREWKDAIQVHEQRMSKFDAEGMELALPAVAGARADSPTWDAFNGVPDPGPAGETHRLTTCLSEESCTDDQPFDVALEARQLDCATGMVVAEPRRQGSQRSQGSQGGVAYAYAAGGQCLAGSDVPSNVTDGPCGVSRPDEAERYVASSAAAQRHDHDQNHVGSDELSAELAVIDMAADASAMGDVLDWDRVMEEHIEQRARTSSVETTLADAFLVQHEAADHATSLPAKRTSTLRAAAHSGKNKNFTMMAPTTPHGPGGRGSPGPGRVPKLLESTVGSWPPRRHSEPADGIGQEGLYDSDKIGNSIGKEESTVGSWPPRRHSEPADGIGHEDPYDTFGNSMGQEDCYDKIDPGNLEELAETRSAEAAAVVDLYDNADHDNSVPADGNIDQEDCYENVGPGNPEELAETRSAETVAVAGCEANWAAAVPDADAAQREPAARETGDNNVGTANGGAVPVKQGDEQNRLRLRSSTSRSVILAEKVSAM